MTLIHKPAALAGTFRRAWGENSQIYTLALWFPNFLSFRTPECQTKCSDQLSPHTWTPFDFQTLSLSPQLVLPSLVAPESFFSAKSPLFILLFLIPMLICFPSLDIPLHPPFQLGWKELQQQESPLSHPLQSDLLWRLLAPGASLAF